MSVKSSLTDKANWSLSRKMMEGSSTRCTFVDAIEVHDLKE